MRAPVLGRKHHPAIWLLLVLAALIGLQVALRIWPLLLAAAVLLLAWRRWQLHHRAVVWSRSPGSRLAQPAVMQGKVDDDTAELARLRGLVDRLEDAANRPITAIIASYERIGRQYGDAAVDKNGGQQ